MEKQNTLKNFMQDNFDFKGLCKAGFFKPEMKNDYEAQAARVCQFFCLKSVYEYGMHVDVKVGLKEGLCPNPHVYKI